MRTAPTYGIRGRRSTGIVGIRSTARTYGKARIGTYAEKADGHITLESEAERLVAHLLCVDPRVRSFRQQPFTVDLVAERVLFTREELSEARRLRAGQVESAEYTPDFATVQSNGLQCAYEVKLEGFEGNGRYWAKVERAREIMNAYCFPLATVIVPANERHPVIVNAQLLKQAMACAQEHLTSELTERVAAYCESGPVFQRTLCADLQIPTNFIPLLLASGVLQADVAHHLIGATLELSAAYGDLSHLRLIEELLA